MTSGIKVMLPGHDIADTNFRNVAYASADNHLNVKLQQTPAHFGLLNYTFNFKPADPSSGVTTNTVLATIVHGLGYVPASTVYAYVAAQDNGINFIPQLSYYPLPVQLNTTVGAYPLSFLGYYCDTQIMQIYYSITGNGTASKDPTGLALQFKYYIFATPGA